MKTHPQSIILIEWRNGLAQLVERGTTPNGLCRGKDVAVFAAFKKLQTARLALRQIKGMQP